MLVCNCAFSFHLRSINLKDIEPIGFSIKLHPLCHKLPGEFQESRAKHKRPFPPASGASLFLSPLDEGLDLHRHLCDSIAQVSAPLPHSALQYSLSPRSYEALRRGLHLADNLALHFDVTDSEFCARDTPGPSCHTSAGPKAGGEEASEAGKRIRMEQ